MEWDLYLEGLHLEWDLHLEGSDSGATTSFVG